MTPDRQPPAAAVENGHRLVWDPPGLSSAERWTCLVPQCRAVAIRYAGHDYGPALERPCFNQESST